jgi:hypothetical protein
MRVALVTTFAASRKEPLAGNIDRIHQAFLDSGLGEPEIRFNFADGLVGGAVSSVDRVLKRYPGLDRFVTSAAPMPAIPGARRISNGPVFPASGERLPYATLHAIAAGVPRSFPFHSVVIHLYTPEFGELVPTATNSADAIAAGVPRSFPFHSVVIHLHTPEFGELVPTATNSAEMMAGVLVTDQWWVNGRVRSLSACSVVEADPANKKLPPPPPAVAVVLAACGKARRTIQAPLDAKDTAFAPVRLPTGAAIPSVNPDVVRTVTGIVAEYRGRLREVVERAALPHDLPPPGEAWSTPPGVATGPKKPVLERAFKLIGYTCRGDSGTFTLRRRTPSKLTLELHLDVGTWGNSVLAIFRVWGLGFKATLILPVSATAVIGAQYPIGDAARWTKIVENLAALVRELERSFVPPIEAAAGPSPDWYQPES